jgi:hypothetical protein
MGNINNTTDIGFHSNNETLPWGTNTILQFPPPTKTEIEEEEILRWGVYTEQNTGIGIKDEENIRCGAYVGQQETGGEAAALMDTIGISTSIEDRIRILRTEMIGRGLETEESLKRLRSYEKKRNDYRCLMEELARYYDRQTALGLPIELQVLKTGIYMQYVILI